MDWRREWDSNPRALSRKLISSQPRYDHFDIPPYAIGGGTAALRGKAAAVASIFHYIRTEGKKQASLRG